MPLDVTNLKLSSLECVVMELGLYPIPKAVLESHKEAEIQKHPPHFLVKHRTLIPVLIMVPYCSCFISSLLLMDSHEFIAKTLLFGGTLNLLSTFFFLVIKGIKVKGYAKWIEKETGSRKFLKNVPSELRNLANEVANSSILPVTFVIGELIQNDVVLDPYLIVRQGCDEIILGIWDGDEIIASAKPF